ncbi:lycopene cyclase family protein [Desulfotomaculum copahuensis]|uniref:FAD-binding domain-containing protein n=1 Tax=Desulfotomaculum copahuensis TaxID=1838280 RepID=A0A1B7LI11_9FIRM|nr:NAD(P)/FAD-dependent oxidoreductase [Desulfotomaculum copahuensis]OAT85898.1 hypothetical protein A6M21_05375 [Desulfotomaculum copahuensis]
MDYDLVVIGAGPAGCAVARDVAAAGRRVLVVEEHGQVGEPMQCAGLISARTLELAAVSREVVLQHLKGARVHGPGGQILTLAGSRSYALAVDRAAFDRELARQAAAAGARIIYNRRAVDFSYIAGGVRVTLAARDKAAGSAFGEPVRPALSGGSIPASLNCGFVSPPAGRAGLPGAADKPGGAGSVSAQRAVGVPGSVTCRLVVGADGHCSAVARWLGLSPPVEKIAMYAAEVELPAASDAMIDIFLGRRVAPGWFGWIIPAGGGRARVGVGSGLAGTCDRAAGRQSPRALFQRLVNRYHRLFRGLKIIRPTGGLVPVGFMPRTYGPHALLVGDAAAQVKPISGGGLYLGLLGARLCARTALAALEYGEFGPAALAVYQRAWEKEAGMEIRCGLRHRETFLNMSDQEMDMLLAFFDRPQWRRIILKYGDLDYHSRIAAKLALAPPWARRFVTGGLIPLLQLFRTPAAGEETRL